MDQRLLGLPSSQEGEECRLHACQVKRRRAKYPHFSSRCACCALSLPERAASRGLHACTADQMESRRMAISSCDITRSSAQTHDANSQSGPCSRPSLPLGPHSLSARTPSRSHSAGQRRNDEGDRSELFLHADD
eukprot:6187206-Pleurochrysis_carterae.AAC.1